MAESTLAATAQRIVAPGKGIFAADVPLKGLVRGWWGESVHASTEDAACDFQEMICRTPGLGEHGIERQFEVTERFLHRTFETLYEHGVSPEEIVLKTNMVVSGSDCPEQAGVNTVARETLRCLRRVVPPAVPGIGFLSGGQSDRDATAHLDAMNRLDPQPWALSFSFGRAIGRAAVEAWDGKTDESERADGAPASRPHERTGHSRRMVRQPGRRNGRRNPGVRRPPVTERRRQR